MITDYVFDVPVGTCFENMSEELKSVIRGFDSEWPCIPMVGTHDVNGRCLLQVRMHFFFTELELSTMLSQFSLDWITVLIRSAYLIDGAYVVAKSPDKSAIIAYFDDIQDGNTTRPPTLLDRIFLPSYAGTEPMEI